MDVTILIIAAIAAFILYTIGRRFYRFYLFRKQINKIPGPNDAIPHLSAVYKLLTMPKQDRLEWFKSVADQFKDGYCRIWLGTHASVHVRKPEHMEVILRSNTEITKSDVYDYLVPWLGRGLLTSTGSAWFHDRKLITPAFHFSILEEFAEVMIDKAAILINCLEQEIKIHGDKPFDIFQLTVRAALDIICETAMGVDLHAQDQVQSEYFQAVHDISEGVTFRLFRPWLKPDCLYHRTALGKTFKKAVENAVYVCTQVIKRKQEERKNGYITNSHDEISEEDKMPGTRKRKAFLDILLEANEKENNPLTIEQIQAQANTFMFAGHDTTGALISWTLFSLGNDLDIQSKVHEELDDILGDADDQTTLKKLPNLKYLERVVKEALRLYPSATSISRRIINDIKIGDYTIPAGANLNLHIYQLHRDPSVWPDPLRFDPDRFLPENVKGRHPYAYLPFSAGPRNCIGQKYAMLEAKLVLTQVLRKYNVRSVETHAIIKKYSEIILRPVDGIYVHMAKRVSHRNN